MPEHMCAVCARRKPRSEVQVVAPRALRGLQLLAAEGPQTPELPREALTTVQLPELGTYCLEPKGAGNSFGAGNRCELCIILA